MPHRAPTATTSLNAILDAQLEALRALKVTLDEEERAVVERDAEALNRVTANKAIQLEQLKTLETERRSATERITGPALAELKHLLGEVRTKNQANASLIQAQSQHLARLLRLLRGGTEARHYGHDGRQLETGRRSPLASA